MRKTNDQIMDDLANELSGLIDDDAADALLRVMRHDKDMMRTIYMIEQYRAGKDLTMAKLAYRNEDALNPLGDLPSRLVQATWFADEWRKKRAA